jgi:uncharacterized protein YbjQ (UPF0145 family)
MRTVRHRAAISKWKKSEGARHIPCGAREGYARAGTRPRQGAHRPIEGVTSPEDTMQVSTTNDIPGARIVRHIGLVRGITVRSRSVVGNFAGGIQSIFGGKLSVFVSLAETARQEALDHLVEHATAAGANAIIGMRYDANEIMEGITEVLAYGTAVVVEPA